MADYHFGGSEEENAELRKLEAELVRQKRAGSRTPCLWKLYLHFA